MDSRGKFNKQFFPTKYYWYNKKWHKTLLLSGLSSTTYVNLTNFFLTLCIPTLNKEKYLMYLRNRKSVSPNFIFLIKSFAPEFKSKYFSIPIYFNQCEIICSLL